MIRSRLGTASLIAAGIATTAMGGFHFLLPQIFAWGRFAQSLPPELQWTLPAMNAFLSLLLLLGGLATLMAMRPRSTLGTWPARSMSVFWAFNAGYQLLRPFPTPGVRWVLLGFALAVATLYLLSVLAGATAPAPLRSGSAEGERPKG